MDHQKSVFLNYPWYDIHIYISLKKLPSALRKSFKKFVPINRIICTVYSTLSYSSALLCKTKREKNREAIKEEFWERERERHTSWSRSVAGVEWLGGAAAVLDGWWFLRLVWGFFSFFLKPMHLGLGFRILRFSVWWGIGEVADFFFFFFFSLSLWANGTVLHVSSRHFIEIVSFWAYLEKKKKTQQQDDIRGVWFVFSNNHFQFLNNISRISIHFFTHMYFHKYF